MACRVHDNKIQDAVALIAENGFEGLGEVIALLINEAMLIERSRYLKATPYERTDDRNGYANGYKNKTIKSRIGALNLQVPQTRDSEFYPSLLEKGVSTRRVKEITEALCGFEVSSSEVSRVAKEMDVALDQWRQRPLGKMVYLQLDARYEKIRQNGCVADSAILIAHGIDEDGKRHVLGVSVSLSEGEVHWRAFLESLAQRGLHGVTMIVSDAHSGLKAARKAVFPSVPWQRCQFHLQQNAQQYVSKKSMKATVAADIRSVFNAPNGDEAQRLLSLMVKKYQDSASDLAAWMEDNIPEGLTVMALPRAHQKRMRTSNLCERVNKEVHRRTKVVGIFPNVESCLRLVTALLVEVDEQWQESRIYLDMQNTE